MIREIISNKHSKGFPHVDRQSNFELLRIIAMLFIVSGHLTSQNDLSFGLQGIDLIVTEFISSMCRISVNLFLMVGTWFLVDSRFSARRILKLYSELWFYCVAFTFVYILDGKPLSLRAILNAFFPMLRGSCWFVPVYIELLLVSPFLKEVLKWQKNRLSLLIAFLFLFTCVINSIHKSSESYFDWFMWFCCMYLFMGFYKKHIAFTLPGKLNKYFALLIAIVLYSLLVCMKLNIMTWLPGSYGNALSKIADQYLVDCKSLPNFIIAFLIFYFFQNINLGSNRVINNLSRSTLAVYLIHQSPNFILILWKDLLKVDTWKTSEYYIVFFLTAVILIFLISELVDSVRLYLLEPLWIRTGVFRKAEEGLTKIYRRVFGDISKTIP